MTELLPAEENVLRTRLHNYGLANWVGKSTTTPAQQLQIAQACVDALDQFDKYEVEIARQRDQTAALTRIMYGTPENPNSFLDEQRKRRAAELELDAALAKLQGLNDKAIRQRRELRRLNKTLRAIWDGVRLDFKTAAIMREQASSGTRSVTTKENDNV